MIVFFSGFAFVHQNPAEQGGRFQLCIFILKKYMVFEIVTFLLPSRSKTVVPHRDKLLLLCWLLATCEQQKLSPRTPSNYDSGKCLLPGPTNICSAEAAPGLGCIESLRVGNFWAGKGMGAVSSSPYSMHTTFLDLPVKTQRCGHILRGAQLCPQGIFNTQRLIPVLRSATSHLYLYAQLLVWGSPILKMENSPF